MFNAREAIAVYRGWELLEHRLPQEIRSAVIDFDLVPEIPDTEDFDSREQVLSRILNLLDSVEVVDETSEFIQAKLNASAYYLRSLMGEQFEFYDYVRNMLGITPELVSEETIDEQKRRVFTLLAEFGVPIVQEEPKKQDFAIFAESIRIYEDEAEKEAREKEAKFLPITLNILGFNDLQVPHRIELVKEEGYWVGWSLGKKGNLLLKYNFHPIHRWRKGDMEYLTLHEVCGHFVHAASLAREIEEGRLDPFIGITTVHDPHGFMGEGIADALTYFFPEELPLSVYGVLSREQRNWRDYLNNNAHILINMGWEENKLLEYILTNPFASTEVARLNLRRWREHSLYRSYQYAYGIALKYHKTFAARMNLDQKIRFLRYAFTRYVTPTRLIDYANSLMQGSPK